VKECPDASRDGCVYHGIITIMFMAASSRQVKVYPHFSYSDGIGYNFTRDCGEFLVILQNCKQ